MLFLVTPKLGVAIGHGRPHVVSAISSAKAVRIAVAYRKLRGYDEVHEDDMLVVPVGMPFASLPGENVVIEIREGVST